MVSRKRRWDLDDQTVSPVSAKAAKTGDSPSNHDQSANGTKAAPGSGRDANTAASKRELLMDINSYLWTCANSHLTSLGEAAARITALLAQKGIDAKTGTETGESPDGELYKDIPINDIKNRYMLTRGATQTMIQQETGAGKLTRLL